MVIQLAALHLFVALLTIHQSVILINVFLHVVTIYRLFAHRTTLHIFLTVVDMHDIVSCRHLSLAVSNEDTNLMHYQNIVTSTTKECFNTDK